MQNMQPDVRELQRQQREFADCIRGTSDADTVDGIAKERLAVYRELFFNNFKDTLASAFPILHQVLPRTQWQQLCKDFFINFRCHSPYLSHMPLEFVVYLKQLENLSPPWLPELAQWEACELELILTPEQNLSSMDGDDVLNDIPRFSPLARLHRFNYPVHQISKEYQPHAPPAQPVYLLAWRKPDDQIGFMQLNDLSARLLELICHNQRKNGFEILAQMAAEHTEMDTALLMRSGGQALSSFHQNTIVLLKSQAEDLLP